jgi:hypothetical protein
MPSADLSDPALRCAHCGAKLRISLPFSFAVSFGSMGLTGYLFHAVGLRTLPLLIAMLFGFIPVLSGVFWALGSIVRLPLQLTGYATLDLDRSSRR